jgi:hypothetical protein
MGQGYTKLICFQKERKITNNQINIKEIININEEFEDMEEIKEDIYVGIGIKKMKGYKCDLKIDELNQKRDHFWDVKTHTKNKNWIVWSTIKRALKYDEKRASLLLEEYKIKPVNGCINHLIDAKGNEYRIPNYCINEPYFGKINSEIKEIKEEKLILNFYGAKKFEMEISNKLKGKELKNDIKIREQLEDDKIIRLFYRGIEIKDEDFLYNHDINETTLINILIL